MAGVISACKFFLPSAAERDRARSLRSMFFLPAMRSYGRNTSLFVSFHSHWIIRCAASAWRRSNIFICELTLTLVYHPFFLRRQKERVAPGGLDDPFSGWIYWLEHFLDCVRKSWNIVDIPAIPFLARKRPNSFYPAIHESPRPQKAAGHLALPCSSSQH